MKWTAAVHFHINQHLAGIVATTTQFSIELCKMDICSYIALVTQYKIATDATGVSCASASAANLLEKQVAVSGQVSTSNYPISVQAKAADTARRRKSDYECHVDNRCHDQQESELAARNIGIYPAKSVKHTVPKLELSRAALDAPGLSSAARTRSSRRYAAIAPGLSRQP